MPNKSKRLSFYFIIIGAISIVITIVFFSIQAETTQYTYQDGIRFLEQGDESSARVVFSRFFHNNPNHSNADEALWNYILLLPETSHAQVYCQRLIRDYPEFHQIDQALDFLGTIYFIQEQFSQSLSIYESLYNRFKQSPLTPKACYYVGLNHLNLQHYQQAIQYFEQLIQLYPNSNYRTHVYFYLSTTYYQRQTYGKSTEYLMKIIQDHPHSPFVPAAYFKLGMTHLRWGNIDRAKQIFRSIQEDYPNSLEADLAASKLMDYGELFGNVYLSQVQPHLSTANQTTVSSGRYYVQIGVFSRQQNANEALQLIQSLGYPGTKENRQSGFKVLAGPFATRDHARQAEDTLKNQGMDTLIIER